MDRGDNTVPFSIRVFPSGLDHAGDPMQCADMHTTVENELMNIFDHIEKGRQGND